MLKTIDEAKFKHLSNLESVLGDICFGNLVLLQGSNDLWFFFPCAQLLQIKMSCLYTLELDLMILVGPVQLRLFYDSMNFLLLVSCFLDVHWANS